METEIKLNQINIKVPGNWNRRIFSPAWISKNFTVPEGIREINLLFNPDDIEIGYKIMGVQIFPKENELALVIGNSDEINNDNILLCFKLFIKILDILPQTPIKAIGFNVDYLLPVNAKSNLGDWIKKQKQDYEKLAMNGLTLKQDTEKYTLNLKIEIIADTFKVDFNYHFKNYVDIDQSPDFFIKLIEDTKRYL